MNRLGQLWVYWIGLIGILSCLHSLAQWNTFSLISLPLVLSVVMAFTIARPWGWFLLLMTVVEFGSHLPPGTLAVACVFPLLLAYVPTRPPSGLSWGFLAYLVLIVAGQATWLTLWPLVLLRQGVSWIDVPAQLPAVIVPSALSAFIAIMVWRERIEPLSHHRTIPRYK